MLSHGMKDCPEGRVEVLLELPVLQYGVWLRGEVSRRGGRDLVKLGTEDGWDAKGGATRDVVGGQRKASHAPGRSLEQQKGAESPLPHLGANDRGEEHTEGGQESRKQRGDHEKGKETGLGEHPYGIIANLEEENREGLWA